MEVDVHRIMERSLNMSGVDINATDKYGRNCLQLVLLNERDFMDYQDIFENYSLPQPSRIYGWPSLFPLEHGLLDTDFWANYAYWEDDPLDVGVVEQLICAGANVNAKDVKNNSCLHYAVENENCCDVISLLANAGAQIDALNYCEDTPLLTAVKVNNIEAVDALIKHGANINASNKYGDTCLHLAENDDMFCLLLNAGCAVPMNCDTSSCGCSPFLAAFDSCKENTLIRMIQAGVDVNFKHRECSQYDCPRWPTPLSAAVAKNLVDIVKLLLEHGANPNEIVDNDGSILYYASSFMHSPRDVEGDEKSADILHLLITHGASVCDDAKLFKIVVEKGNLKAVHMFLDEFRRRNKQIPADKSLLHLALQNDRDDVFQFILETTFKEFDEADEVGYTAFHRAIKWRARERAQVLLDYGADINTVNHRGISALETALIQGNISCIELFLSYASLPFWRIDLINSRHQLSKILSDYYSAHRDDVEKIVTYIALIESVGRLNGSDVLAQMRLHRMHPDTLQELYERAKTEIQLSQTFIISNSVTIYDVLTKMDHRYMRNENLVKKFGNETLYDQFPIYERLIRRRFTESQRAHEQLSQAVTNLNRLLKFDYPTFHQIYDNILCRLRLMDLIILQRI